MNRPPLRQTLFACLMIVVGFATAMIIALKGRR